MKKKFKAFTLVELIVVIAIFGIIMAGLMNFYRPIRETYVDSTLYEQQRNIHNGVLEYLCETTRYADNIKIYDQGYDGVNNAYKAVCNFYDDAGISKTDSADADKRAKVRVFVINRSDYYDKNGNLKTSAEGKAGTAFRGRIITNIEGEEWKSTYTDAGQRPAGTADGKTYMALGGAYYGASDHVIYVDESSSGTALVFGIADSMKNTGNVVQNGGIQNGGSSLQVDRSNGNVMLISTQRNVLKNAGSNFAYSYDSTHGKPHGTTTDTGSITGKLQNTYIVFTLPEEF